MTALIVRAGFEVVGVASVAPFMSVVADPGAIVSNEHLHRVYETFGFGSSTAFLMALGIGLIVVLALSNGISALTIWAMLRFSWGVNHRLSMRMLRGYMAQPYAFFVGRNTATLNTLVLAEVQSVVSGIVTPLLELVARSLVVCAITALRPDADPLPFHEGVTFDRVSFSYPESQGWALREVSLRIPRNETIGLIGPSGSGKTSLVDLLLGL